MFENRKLIIATKHKKETVIAPILEKGLGVKCFTDETFDTDILGTFTGEVERKLDPIATARQKCLMAMELSNSDLAVASEGSFGPHPTLFFIPADDEFLIFLDKKNNLEIIVRELSTQTNFNGQEIKSEKELLMFAEQVNFPTHALIIRKSKEENSDIYKGITDLAVLKKVFHDLDSKYTTFYVETDMRAMYNPTRMGVIAKATEKLVKKINSACPKCKSPGFGATDVKKGLECKLCGLPTQSTLSYIYSCLKCDFTKEEMYPHNKTSEDPMYCNYCNP